MSHPPPARSRSADRSNRPRSTGKICFGFVSPFRASVWILATSIYLLASCTSPTPPPPPPPPPAGPDTTSHEFIWQIDTLGDGNSSVLYDVAIINDTTIWAVGEIYLKDSTGQVDPDAYGLAKWDGTKWSFSRLGALAPQGYVSNLLPRAIFAIAPNEIWFAAGGAHRLKNNVLTPFWINDFPGNPSPIWTSGQLSTRIWASTSSNVYVVGTAGAIAHFDGTTWRRIESGTTVDVGDIFGLSGTTEAFAVAWGQGTPTKLLKLVGGTYQLLYDDVDYQFVVRSDSLSGRLTSVAAYGSKLFVLSPTGLYETSFDTHGEARRLSFAEAYFPGFPTSVRGTGPNDLFIVGQRSLIAHYNGSTWRWFQNYSNDFVFLNACAARVDVVVAVGQLYISPILSRAVVFVGRR